MCGAGRPPTVGQTRAVLVSAVVTLSCTARRALVIRSMMEELVLKQAHIQIRAYMYTLGVADKTLPGGLRCTRKLKTLNNGVYKGNQTLS